MCAMTALYALLFSDAATAFGSNELSSVYKYKVSDENNRFDPHVLHSPNSPQDNAPNSQLSNGSNNQGKAFSGVSVSIEDAAKEEGFVESPALKLKSVVQKPLVLSRNDKALASGTSPVVVKELKLVFFSIAKNGGTQFKKLFRRVAGRKEWNQTVTVTGNSSKSQQTLVHDPKRNGLSYLSGYSPKDAADMVNDKDWTVAVFFRDPYSRFLSVYLDNFARKPAVNIRVNSTEKPTGKAKMTSDISFAKFISLVETGAIDTVASLGGNKLSQGLTPQCSLIDCDKWYPYMTYIGSFENIYEDTRTLLERLQAWDKYGGNGWGGATGELFKETIDTELVTNATHRMHEYYTPSLLRRVSALVSKDVEFLRKVKLERATAADRAKVLEANGSQTSEKEPVSVLDPTRLNGLQPIVLKKGDIELKRHSWEGSPIVVEKFKLIFFSVPKNSCTIFKKLFRRIEGKSNWNAFTRSVPHDPRRNGLRYLYKYSVEEANRIVNDPSWTVAIFVRDPYARFLSAYLDKGKKRVSTFSGFITRVERGLKNVHWNAQCHLVDCPKWLPRFDFIGSIENIFEDTKELLQRLGAWEEYGANGWGGTGEIFKGSVHKGHVTNADDKLSQYYTPQLKTRVKALLHKDFEFIDMVQRLKSGNITAAAKRST